MFRTTLVFNYQEDAPTNDNKLYFIHIISIIFNSEVFHIIQRYHNLFSIIIFIF